MLNSKQKKCIEMLTASNRTQKEIAGKLRVTEETVCNWKKNDEFMTEYTTSLKNSTKDMAAKAFCVEKSLLKARSETVRLMAAKDILDRVGFKTDDNINLNGEAVILVNDLQE